jgi:hypothetical protein
MNGAFKVPGLQRELAEMKSQVPESILSLADRTFHHMGNFFELRDLPLGEQIDWHRDYRSGMNCPTRYSGLINYRNPSLTGDAKYIWELNRLQHLMVLELATLATANESYRKEIGAQTLSWHRANPFMKGLNWKSPLEAGIRLITWACILFLDKRLDWKTEIYPGCMQQIVYQHLYFIRKFYSKHSSANNHLIGEMAGLYVGCVFWPYYRESTTWRLFARGKLIEEILNQVEADGVGKERATEYQAFVLEFFLLAGALGQLIGEPFPDEYWHRLNSMLGFLSAISNRAGDLPLFGDGDSGQVLWLPETTAQRVQNLIHLGEVGGASRDNSDLRATLLLWGQRPHELVTGVVPQRAEKLKSFPNGGYYVLAANRGGENELLAVFDAGPLGFPPLNAHGHADALSFWLSYGGQEFLIDPGTYCYYSSPHWRSYFRGTASHNTLRIDGQDQSVSGGLFLWETVANCQAANIEENEEFVEVEGCHDGYHRLEDPVNHRRSLRLLQKSPSLVITDSVDCRKKHKIELFFHLAKNCEIRQAGAHLFEISKHNKRLVLKIDSQLKAELYNGSESPISGWASPHFGVKHPTFTLVACGEATGSTKFVTEILTV